MGSEEQTSTIYSTYFPTSEVTHIAIAFIGHFTFEHFVVERFHGIGKFIIKNMYPKKKKCYFLKIVTSPTNLVIRERQFL